MKKFRQNYYLPLKRLLKGTLIYLSGNRKYKKVVIIGRQRTGSSLLVWLLGSHPHIDLEGEAFRLLKGSSCREVWNRNFGKKLPWIKYTGFKIFYYHPEDSDDKEVWKMIEGDKDIRLIHIKRHNLLRTHVSKLIAEKTGAWNSRQEENTFGPEDKRVEVDIAQCLQVFRDTKKWEDDFGIKRFPAHPYLELTYEQLTNDTQSQMNYVMDFLGLKRINVKLKSRLNRQNPERIQDLVSNFAELEKHLKLSEYAYLVDETTKI